MALQQLASEDSGYWDYALLMFYDEIVHSVIFSGLVSLTDFGWAERTAVLASGGLDINSTQTLLHMCKKVGGFFVMLGRNFILLCLLSALALLSHGWVFAAADSFLGYFVTLVGDALLTKHDL